MCLGQCRNARELHLLSKQPHCIRHKEEDAEAILYPPLNFPSDGRGNLWGAGRGVRPLGDGCLQCLGIPRGYGVGRDALLYVRLYEGRIWMPNPLRQASQCLPLIGGKE